jgi:hypothetical protein
MEYLHLVMWASIVANGKAMICQEFFQFCKILFPYFDQREDKEWWKNIRNALCTKLGPGDKGTKAFSKVDMPEERFFQIDKKDTGGKEEKAYGMYNYILNSNHLK